MFLKFQKFTIFLKNFFKIFLSIFFAESSLLVTLTLFKIFPFFFLTCHFRKEQPPQEPSLTTLLFSELFLARMKFGGCCRRQLPTRFSWFFWFYFWESGLRFGSWIYRRCLLRLRRQCWMSWRRMFVTGWMALVLVISERLLFRKEVMWRLLLVNKNLIFFCFGIVRDETSLWFLFCWL